MTRHRRSPRPLAFAFEAIADDLAPETLLADVQREWRRTVGESVAAQAQPTAERGGAVTVSCSASVWAQELDLMAPQIIEGLNARLSRGRVQRLRCLAVGPLR
jgi:predicted nucleic acid-binding Zn ribbon protein